MRLLRRADFHVGAHVNTFWRTPCRGAAEGPSKKSVVWENKHITWFGESRAGRAGVRGGAGRGGQPRSHGASCSHAGRWHRAPAAHAGEDVPAAADAAERADHHAAPPRRPQPQGLPVGVRPPPPSRPPPRVPPPYTACVSPQDAACGPAHPAERRAERSGWGAAQPLLVPEHHGAWRTGQEDRHHP